MYGTLPCSLSAVTILSPASGIGQESQPDIAAGGSIALAGFRAGGFSLARSRPDRPCPEPAKAPYLPRCFSPCPSRRLPPWPCSKPLPSASSVSRMTATRRTGRQPLPQDRDATIRQVYQQVLGQQYVMQNERLAGAESLFRNGYLTVREFVRTLAKSGSVSLPLLRILQSLPLHRAQPQASARPGPPQQGRDAASLHDPAGAGLRRRDRFLYRQRRISRSASAPTWCPICTAGTTPRANRVSSSPG